MEQRTWMTDNEDIYWNNAVKRKYCPACGKRPLFDRETGAYILTNFCPHCGTDLRGNQNAEANLR